MGPCHKTQNSNNKKTVASLADGRIELLKSYIWLLIGTINKNHTKYHKILVQKPRQRKGDMEEYEPLAVKVP